MHILLTVNAAWNIQNFRLPIVTALLADGHRVTILAPADDSVVPALEAKGCAFVPLDMDIKGLNPIRDLALVFRMRQHFKALKPDVILSYTIKNNIFGALAAKPLGIRFVPNVTGLGTAFLSGRIVQRIATALYRRAFSKLAVVFFQNPDDRDLFLEHGLITPEQAQLLPGSGIDLDRFAMQPMPDHDAATTPVFLMIARLLRDKGTIEYVEAARIVKTQVPGARFQLLGPIAADNRTAISADIVAEWEDEGIIEYLGTADDVRPYIAAADCVVLPSYREGAPRTLIEAAAMGRPVITTDVPGCRSVVVAGETGLLCDVRDASSLAGACLELQRYPVTALAEMGAAGRDFAQRTFDQRIVVDAYKRAILAENTDGQL